MAQTISVLPPAEDLAFLERIARDRGRPLKHVLRARVVLLSAQRLSVFEVAKRADVSRPMVWGWQRRYAEEGVKGLRRSKTCSPGIAPTSQGKVPEVVAMPLKAPLGGVTHWSGRAMAKASGLSLRTIQRIWADNKLQPHRVRTCKHSTDPDFAAKLHDLVGLYINPPRHAVVFSINEKSQIKALDRTQPGLPLKRGLCASMTHDYKRNGTTTLFAALDKIEGKVIGQCVARHRHQEFIGFLAKIARGVLGKIIHAIADNYSAHKHLEVKA